MIGDKGKRFATRCPAIYTLIITNYLTLVKRFVMEMAFFREKPLKNSNIFIKEYLNLLNLELAEVDNTMLGAKDSRNTKTNFNGERVGSVRGVFGKIRKSDFITFHNNL